MDEGMQHAGKLLIILGVMTAIVGVLLTFSGRLPWLGKLPGDIVIHRKNFTFYFPLVTSILVSIIITLLLWLFGKK